jgi:cell wall-associated NlpC family hydrolase
VLLNSDDGNAVGQRTGYLRAAVGDRQQLIDALNATEQDLSTQIAELGAAQAKAQSVTDDLAARKSSADAAVAQQTQLLSSVKGELAQLVQQEQTRRAQAAAAAAAAHASAASHSSGHSGGGTSGGTSGGGGTATPPPQSGGAAGAVALARQQIGKPYVWGASGPSAFDCSGLTYYVWKYGGGVTLPHNSASQWSATTHIPISALAPGDLVFYGHPIHHVAIYVGGGQIIHAPHAGASVTYDSLYYWDALVGAGRVG